MKTSVLCVGLLCLVGSAAQAQTALFCNASVPKPLATSATGTAELVGDYVLTCSGGTGLSNYDLTIYTNTNVASSAGAPTLVVDAGSGDPIVGSFTGANTVVFRSVPYQAATPPATRLFRITGLRVNSSLLGVSSTGIPTQIMAYAGTTTGGNALAINNPQQTVGTVLAAGSIQCTASAIPLAVAATGTAELAGDYLLTCMGGSGTVATDVTILINTNVSSIYTPTLAVDGGSGTSVVGAFGTAPNAVIFPNVTFAAPGTAAARTLRVSGLHVNASQLGLSTSGPTSISGSATVSNSLIVVNGSTQTVATISSNAPVIISLSPSSVTAGSLAFPLSIYGLGFDNGAVALWQNGSTSFGLITTYVSSTQLLTTVPALLLGGAGTAIITVQNTNSALSSGVPFVVGSIAVPTVVSLQPPVSSGTSQPLAFQFSHPSGYASLSVMNVLINTALDGRHGCYLAYSMSANTLYLINDAGDAGGPYAGSLVMNGSGSVSNSQCTISGAGSLVVGSGNTLTITLNMAFSSAFGGNKVIYAAARDASGGNTGWQTMGVHGVPPLPSSFPNPVGVAPAYGSTGKSILALTYQEASSALNLQTSWMLVNTALDGRNACYVAYYRPGNQLFLVPDNGDGTQASGMSLSGTGSLSNSQCIVSAQGSSAVMSGNTLTVSLNVSFRSPLFTGAKGVWMATSTLAGAVSGWQALGAWMVP